ncbi:FixH family protein [Silvimonas iriomotensis]|uniref:Nitrogen fixation protein FixH n=1 Tax=Silvimonas iriomotensis TaxID=449662 RepID=A0ABQ2P6U5_9NEIS|nr:FixH family protein [Silvimonas iriomotensis]GGP19130.1 hypothetical protein GCM10010970_09090 [Silvimonas iriomotensis]
MQTPSSPEKRPWYKQPWAWFILLLPVIAIVGCINLIWLAGKHSDGVVADDYTRTGDEVTQVLARDQAAARLGLRATATIDAQGLARIELNQPVAGPLQLKLLHPTVARNDQAASLSDQGNHLWQGQLAHPPGAVRWDVELSDNKNTWRLRGQMKPGQSGKLVLSPAT